MILAPIWSCAHCAKIHELHLLRMFSFMNQMRDCMLRQQKVWAKWCVNITDPILPVNNEHIPDATETSNWFDDDSHFYQISGKSLYSNSLTNILLPKSTKWEKVILIIPKTNYIQNREENNNDCYNAKIAQTCHWRYYARCVKTQWVDGAGCSRPRCPAHCHYWTVSGEHSTRVFDQIISQLSS